MFLHRINVIHGDTYPGSFPDTFIIYCLSSGASEKGKRVMIEMTILQ